VTYHVTDGMLSSVPLLEIITVIIKHNVVEVTSVVHCGVLPRPIEA